MTPLVLFLLACLTIFLGCIESAFSSLMKLSLRLMAERGGRNDLLGEYLDEPLRLFVPVRLLIAACVIAFSDAGKPCRDGADCQGNCIAATEQAQGGSGAPATGICAADDNPCGCKTTIEDGRAQATVCVD